MDQPENLGLTPQQLDSLQLGLVRQKLFAAATSSPSESETGYIELDYGDKNTGIFQIEGKEQRCKLASFLSRLLRAALALERKIYRKRYSSHRGIQWESLANFSDLVTFLARICAVPDDGSEEEMQKAYEEWRKNIACEISTLGYCSHDNRLHNTPIPADTDLGSIYYPFLVKLEVLDRTNNSRLELVVFPIAYSFYGTSYPELVGSDPDSAVKTLSYTKRSPESINEVTEMGRKSYIPPHIAIRLYKGENEASCSAIVVTKVADSSGNDHYVAASPDFSPTDLTVNFGEENGKVPASNYFFNIAGTLRKIKSN